MPLQKKNRLRSAKNEIVSLLCILVDRPMGGIEPPTPPLRTPLHTWLVVEKLYMARAILSKLRRLAPQSVLKCVYYSLVYPHLYYGVTSWGNTATKYTKTST